MSVVQADVVHRVENVETAAIAKAAIGGVMQGRTRKEVRLANLLLLSVGVSDGVVVRLRLRKGLNIYVVLSCRQPKVPENNRLLRLDGSVSGPGERNCRGSERSKGGR